MSCWTSRTSLSFRVLFSILVQSVALKDSSLMCEVTLYPVTHSVRIHFLTVSLFSETYVQFIWISFQRQWIQNAKEQHSLACDGAAADRTDGGAEIFESAARYANTEVVISALFIIVISRKRGTVMCSVASICVLVCPFHALIFHIRDLETLFSLCRYISSKCLNWFQWHLASRTIPGWVITWENWSPMLSLASNRWKMSKIGVNAKF